MSAQPQPKQDQSSRSQRQSTETRLAVVETRWEDVVPNLATKHDLSDLRADLKDSIARSESKTTDAVTALRVEMKDGNASLLKWVVGTMLAGLGGVVGIMALLLSVMTPKPVAPVPQPAPIIQSAPAPVQPDQERSDWSQPERRKQP